MGVGPVAGLRRGDADFGHHLQHPLFLLRPARAVKGPGQAGDEAVQPQRFADLLAHRKNRVERAERVLKNHGDFLTADSAEFAGGQLAQVLPFK